MATGRYKVMRAFQRWEGKALRQYARGAIIPSKDAARIKSLDILIAAGAVYRMPDGDDTEIKAGHVRDHGALNLVISSPIGYMPDSDLTQIQAQGVF